METKASLDFLRLAVGQGHLCRLAGWRKEKLERSKHRKTTSHCWENLHDEMRAVQFAASFFPPSGPVCVFDHV